MASHLPSGSECSSGRPPAGDVFVINSDRLVTDMPIAYLASSNDIFFATFRGMPTANAGG